VKSQFLVPDLAGLVFSMSDGLLTLAPQDRCVPHPRAANATVRYRQKLPALNSNIHVFSIS
jgi:hypothetical protein